MKTPKIILALAMLAVSTLGACTTATNEIIDSHWDLLYLNGLSAAIAPITLRECFLNQISLFCQL